MLWDSERRTACRLSRCANVDALREQARAVLPRPIFDLYDGASFRERTLARNIADLSALRFRQRVMRDVSTRSLDTTILGQSASMPMVVAPVGLSGLLHRPDSELASARAAKAAGIPFVLGAMSIRSIEDVVREVGPVWFQVFPLRDRGLVAALIDRAAAAGAPVLVVTVSWPVIGRSNRSVRNGTDAIPPRLTPALLWEFLRKPRWTLCSMMAGAVRMGNFEGLIDISDFASIASQVESAQSWSIIEDIRARWHGKLVIKGILDEGDAARAFDIGADAIDISNHGGNCLDEAESTIAALPRIADRVGDRGEILMDGGIRTGQDVLKAKALGANACLIGRAHLYGLAAGGQAGVAAAIERMRQELSITMGYVGLDDVNEASPAILANG